ncbi:MAG: hypothetical protein IJW13_03255 [Clostridia bacterium]|nr:hypothetical protein [Clostridia bacterium]
MNKNKIIQYLNSKKNDEYNYLDILLEKYCNGELSQLLSKYKFTNIEIFPQISKNGNSIEMCLTYQNIATNISLTDDEIEYSIYQLYATANEVSENTFKLKCNEEFSFEDLLNSIYEKMLNHYKLKDLSIAAKNKKIYNTVATIFLLVPIIFIGIMVALVLGFEYSIKFNFWWVLFFIIIPLFLYTFLNRKSHKK